MFKSARNRYSRKCGNDWQRSKEKYEAHEVWGAFADMRTSFTTEDGLYIPAGTGVLLKAVDGTTPEGYYYQIGEQGRTGYGGENAMQEVTVNSRRVDGTEGTATNFYVSKGSLHRWSGQMTMPVHRSYLSLSDVPTGAKVMMVFEDMTTDVDTLDDASSWDEWPGAVYDLQGRKLSDAQSPNRQIKKGIYVVSGHKIVVR